MGSSRQKWAETISAYKPNYDGFEWDDYQFSEEEDDSGDTRWWRNRLQVRILYGRQTKGHIPSVLYTVERVIGYMWVQAPLSLLCLHQKKIRI